MLIRLCCVLWMTRVIHGDAEHAYTNLVDPFTLDNKFHVDCGYVNDKKMTIVFRGDASFVYAPKSSLCVAQEVEPGNFLIEDAFASRDCTLAKDESADIYMLEVVAQEGAVRTDTDLTQMIYCSYETHNRQTSGNQRLNASSLRRVPAWGQASGSVARSRVTLGVYDTSKQEVDTVTLGTAIQLRMYMAAAGNETSFRVESCKMSSYKSGPTIEYPFLMGGCGYGDIIRSNRGFRTTLANLANSDRIARTPYFRSVSLPGADRFTFQCYYIICMTSDCDGPSCKSSARKTRDISSYSLHKVVSRPLRVLPLDKTSTATTPNTRQVTGQTSKIPDLPGQPSSVREGNSSPYTPEIIFMTIGMLFLAGSVVFFFAKFWWKIKIRRAKELLPGNISAGHWTALKTANADVIFEADVSQQSIPEDVDCNGLIAKRSE